MFWREHSYVAFSTTYVGYLTLRRKSAYLRRKKISCCQALTRADSLSFCGWAAHSSPPRRVTRLEPEFAPELGHSEDGPSLPLLSPMWGSRGLNHVLHGEAVPEKYG